MPSSKPQQTAQNGAKMAPFFLGDNLRTRRPGVRIPHGVPKRPETVRFRVFLFCISCCFLPLLFSDPYADPNGRKLYPIKRTQEFDPCPHRMDTRMAQGVERTCSLVPDGFLSVRQTTYLNLSYRMSNNRFPFFRSNLSCVGQIDFMVQSIFTHVVHISVLL